MSTFLSKIFKPKWQSKQKATRLEAVQTLNSHQAAELEILLSLATNDPEQDVQIAAISRIQDTQTLIDLHKKVEGAVREHIEQSLYDMANKQSLSIFDLIIDLDLLTDMIVASASPEAFINGLARLEDSAALLKIALNGKTARIRQAAAELLESEQALKELAQSAKAKDKGTYQIAKTKLDKLRHEAKLKAEQTEQIDKVLHAIEELAKTDNLKLYDSKLESLIQRWSKLSKLADVEQQAQYQSAETCCLERANALKAEAAAQAEAELLEQAGGSEQAATLLTLEQTIQRFTEQAASVQEYASLDAILKTQETRWLEATRQASVEKTNAKRYQLLMGQLRTYLKALDHLSEKQQALKDLTQEINQLKEQAKPEQEQALQGASKTLARILEQLSWPENFAQPELLAQAEKALGISRDLNQKLAKNAEQIQSQIEDKLTQLDRSLEEKQLKDSNKTLRQIQQLMSQLSGKQSERFNKGLNLRIKQLHALRDWQGEASTPRQIELCEQMERLAEQSLAPQDKAEKIKAMQAEWKRLGGARDEALWTRFKAASDLAYEPCKTYFSEQSQLKQSNLEKRKTLLDQLKHYVENNDWENTDWKAADEINRKARREWREAYPVDHKAGKNIQKEFNQTLDKLDTYLETEREKNHALKQSLVEQAEALVEHEDLHHAMDQAKALQKQWQGIGITSHKKDRAQWKAFRKACDSIFERRDQERETRKQEFTAAIESAEQMITEFQAKLDVESLAQNDLEALLDELQQANKQLPNLPSRAAEKHQSAYEALRKTAKARLQSIENQKHKLAWENVAACSRILRQSFLDEARDVDAVQAQLDATESLTPALERLIKELWISIKAGAVKASQIIDAEGARALCIRCEIAAGIDSPESDKELRMQLQVSRLSEGLSASEHATREEQLSDALKTWYSSVGLDAESFVHFETRIEKAKAALFQ